MEKIKESRKRIDRIDSNILRLLNERARIILQIGSIKSKNAKPSFSPYREAQVYDSLLAANKGPLSNNTVKAIYREIMSGSLSLQNPPRIAYLGPKTTFTHIAALNKFGRSLDYLEAGSIADVFTEVERGRADYGVVPIENSTEGAVNYTLDIFIDSDLKICSELYLPIEHNLLSLGKLSSIKRVYSHQQVLAQCRIWLETHLPGAELIPVANTALAAERVRHLKVDIKVGAAIASRLAAERCGLKILASSIEDSSHNITRFLIIGKHEAEPSGNDKTSIVFSMKDRSGALHDVLRPFKRSKINLTKIESRPSKKKAWKYYFFVDMDGHIKNKKVKRALKQLEKNCTYLKILGSYPAEV